MNSQAFDDNRFIGRAKIDHGAWWLLQDNAPTHKSHRTQGWMFAHGIQQIDFPPYSPDLNPIDNLWNHVARRVEKRQPQTEEELSIIVDDEWYKTPAAYTRRLARSMPKRCARVIAADGYCTKY